MKKYLLIFALLAPSLTLAAAICDLEIVHSPSGLSKKLPSITDDNDYQSLPITLLKGLDYCAAMVRHSNLHVTCFDDRIRVKTSNQL